MPRDDDDDLEEDEEEIPLGDLTRMVITVSIGVAVGCLVLLALAYFRDKKLPTPVVDLGAPGPGADGVAPVAADQTEPADA